MAVEGLREDRRGIYKAIYAAIGPSASYIRVEQACKTVGVGMAPSARGWTGLLSIATAREFRRQGVATRVICQLARWGLANGAPNLYLQVMSNNDRPIRLYADLGFS